MKCFAPMSDGNRVGGCTAKKEVAYIELMWEWRDEIHALSILITKE